MTLKITKPTGQKLVIKKPTGQKLKFRPTWQPMDPDAATYITAVETADGQALEEKVKIAIDNFVLGCKADGIWNAIMAACILACARTLSGALVPLKGTAPTNFNFVSGDYNRKTGLAGDGSTKYLNSNRAGSADPQNSFSLAVYATQVADGLSSAAAYIGNGGLGTGASSLFRGYSGILAQNSSRCRSATSSGLIGPNPPATGLFSVSRSSSSQYIIRTDKLNTTISTASETPATGNHFVFAREDGAGSPSFYSNGRLAFYSIGESLDLALLDARVTALINALSTAIA